MAEYTEHEKAVVLDEICAELTQIEWLEIWKTPGDDSWEVQFDGTIQVSAFAAQMIQDLMPKEPVDGQS